jgi:hypothetical protein
MAKMYTTAKVNPLTGMATDNNPKKEARQEKRQVRREEKALNKSLNEGIKKQGQGLKRAYKGTSVEETSSTKKPKDWREKSRVGALIGGTPYAGGKDKGGKKKCGVKEGKGGRPDYSNMDESCKNPYAK